MFLNFISVLDMVDVELIEFKAPSGGAKSLFLTQIKSEESDPAAVSQMLTEHFSQWGLVYNVKVLPSDDDETHIAYVRYYSTRAAAFARRHNEGLD